MSATADQIKELLGVGLSNDVVASATGVSVSYISQLMSDQTFADEVSTLKILSLTANTKRDNSLDSLEDKLITKVHSIIDDQLIYKPLDVVRTLVLINAMKRRGAPVKENPHINNVTVNLTMPTQLTRQFTITSQGEVIEAEGQTLVSMPASSLLKQLSERSNSSTKLGDQDVSDPSSNERYKELSKYLPSSQSSSSRTSE